MISRPPLTTTTMSSPCDFVESISPEGYRRALSQHSLTEPETVVSTEKPFAFQLHRRYSDQYCANCLIKFDATTGKRCLGGCELTFYCSRECQKDHFVVHKYTCKKYHSILKAAVWQFNSFVVGAPLRDDEEWECWEDFLLARIVYIKLCQLTGRSVKAKSVAADWKLPSEIEALCEGPKSNANCQHDALEMVLATTVASSFGINGPQGSMFSRLLRKFRFNNFGITNNLQQVIASAVFPRGAILNHSCDPNCILTYELSPVRQVIRTIKPVEKGDELYHAYVDVCLPTNIRQSRLLETYFIQCNCDRCQGVGQWREVEEALVEGDAGLSEEEKSTISALLSMAQSASIDNVEDSADDLMREYDTLCKALSIQHKKLGRHNLERYKTECLALSVSLMIGGREAISHAQAIVDFLGFVCNEYHPLLLLQRQTLSELKEAFACKS